MRVLRDPVLRRLAVLALTDLMARSAAMVALVLIARWLGPAAYGVFAAGFAAGSIAASLTEGGLTNHLMREAATPGAAHIDGLTRAVERLRLALTALSAVVAAMATLFTAGGELAALTAAFLTTALGLRWVAQTHAAALLGLGDARAGFLQQGAERIALVFLVVTLVVTADPSPLLAAGAFAFAATTGWIASRRLWVKRRPPAVGDQAALRLWLVIRQAWPLTVAGFGVAAFLYAGPLFLRARWGDAEAGVFGAALGLYLPLVGLPALVMKAVISELASDDPSAHARAALTRLAYGAVALPGLLAVAAPEITAVVLGPRYGAAAAVLRILAFGAAASFVTSFFFYFLLARRRERAYTAAVIGGMIASFAVAPGAVGAWGARGAAVALVTAEVACLMLAGLLARDTGHFRFDAILPTAARAAGLALVPLGAATAVLLATAGEWTPIVRLMLAGAAALAGLYTTRGTLRPTAA